MGIAYQYPSAFWLWCWLEPASIGTLTLFEILLPPSKCTPFYLQTYEMRMSAMCLYVRGAYKTRQSQVERIRLKVSVNMCEHLYLVKCYRLIRQMWIGCRRQVYGVRSRKMCCSCTVMLAETSHHQHSSYGMHLCTVINTTFSCWSMGRLVEHRATSNLSRTLNMLADAWHPICGISSNRACERKVWHVLVTRWALIYVDNCDDTLASGCRR